MAQQFKVKVNDTFEFNITATDVQKLDIINLSPTQFHVLNNNKSFIFNLETSTFQSRDYHLTENGDNYAVKIENNLDKLIKDIGLSITNSKKSKCNKGAHAGIYFRHQY